MKKTNSPKLEDILSNLCKQVERQNEYICALAKMQIEHSDKIKAIANIVKFNLRLNDKYNAKLRLLDLKQISFASKMFIALLIANLLGLLLNFWK